MTNKKSSESIIEISGALAKFWGEVENPKHNQTVSVQMKKGGSYKFAYTDLGGINDTIRPGFKKNGLAYMQDAETVISEGKQFLSVTTKLIHESGEWIESSPLIVSANMSIQDMGGQITYLKRYSISSMLGLATEQDDDANASIGNKATFDQPDKKPEKKEAPKLSATQKTEIEKLANQYLKLRPKGTMKDLMQHLKITDLNLIIPKYADDTIETLNQMIALVQKKDKELADSNATKQSEADVEAKLKKEKQSEIDDLKEDN